MRKEEKMENRSSHIVLTGTVILFILAAALFSRYEYIQDRQKIYRQIDEKLITSARGASMVLPDGFQGRAATPDAITAEEDRRNIDRLSRFAETMDVTYVYTIVHHAGKIRFTASSATAEERRTGVNLTRYFDPYDDASEALRQAFATGRTQFGEYTDKWGTFRSVFVPMKTSSGITYVAAADIRIDAIEQLLKKDVLGLLGRFSLVIALILLILGWRFLYINRSFLQQKERLEQAIEEGTKNIKQTNTELNAILNATEESIFLLDKEGTILTINRTAAERLDKTPSELVGKCVYDFFPRKVAQRRRKNVEQVFETGQVTRVEDEREGRCFSLNYYPVFDENGRAASIVVFAQDITARKKAENELRKLTVAVEQSPNSIIITDREGKIEYVNAAFTKITGFEPSEALGRNPKFLQSGKTPPQTFKEMWIKLHRGEMWSGEFVNRAKDGSEYIFSVTVSPFCLSDGEISHYMAIEENITEKKRSEDHIRHLTNFDALTALPNRQKLQFDIDQRHPYACAILNIDNFKEMNDFFGITSGDTLLRRFAEWLRAMGFSPYRIGGDEFAILFYEKLTQEQLHSRIASLLAALDEERFIVDDETLDMHMTVGVAMGDGKLLTRSDIAVHTAKERKIPIAFYEEAENIEEQYRINIAMAGEIRKALVGGRIVCQYQPIVNIATGITDKYETLVRLIDEEGNTVPPMQFLPIAKKTKLYPRITKEVIHQACRTFASRTEEFSLNISIADIHDPSTVQEIISTITRTRTASRIVFEILESEGIENYTEVAEFIHAVKQLGAKIAIDDFGTGYSNFEHVLRLNVDYLKIDGSLIRGSAENPRNRIIVETVVDFASKIGTKTIAEFVSDEAVFNTVKAMGIDYAQGFYTGKPGPVG